MESVGERGFSDFISIEIVIFVPLQLTFLTADHGNCEVGSWGKMAEKEQGGYF